MLHRTGPRAGPRPPPRAGHLETNPIAHMASAATRPATGRVTTHESTISETFPHFTFAGSFFKPPPTMAPVETCVVETGRLAHDAADTSAAVVRLAVSDSASGRGVSFFASVSSPLRRPT